MDDVRVSLDGGRHWYDRVTGRAYRTWAEMERALWAATPRPVVSRVMSAAELLAVIGAERAERVRRLLERPAVVRPDGRE